MTKRIFRSILLAAAAAMLACLLLVTAILSSYFTGIQKARLSSELNLAAAAAEENGVKYLDAVKTDGFRLTWIAEDGKVLYDSEADASRMENHAGREEVREALETGNGETERYSATLTEKSLYSARRLSDGTVLRISVGSATAVSLMFGMLQPILIVFILLIILSAVLARGMARRIVDPLNTLNLEQPMENSAYEELAPLLRRINQLHGQVKGQLRELQKKKEEFEQITGSMSEGLVLLDAECRVISINNAALTLFEADKGSIGSDFITIDRSHEINEAIEASISGGSSEIRIQRGGREYQLDVSRIKSEEGATGTVLLAFDVTDRVFAERNRREFTANVSHELKTPLQSIMGSAELIENGLVAPEDMPKFVGRIRSEAARLVALIEDIIRLSQLDEGQKLEREDVDLYAVAEEALSSLEFTAAEKKVKLELSGEHTTVRGVRKLLFEAVFNLCENAIKYNVEGGSVSVKTEIDEENAILSISDTGIGISPEHQGRIFERFYRVDKSRSRSEAGGTGLGLSIVKHAVQYHGGTVEISSVPGAGSTFTVTISLK